MLANVADEGRCLEPLSVCRDSLHVNPVGQVNHIPQRCANFYAKITLLFLRVDFN
jgi:hypothetical protein